MTYLAGQLVLDIKAGAPNNGRGDDNRGVVKKIRTRGHDYPYVSAQAFRRWLRDSLPAGEPVSPVTRAKSGAKQQAYTAGRPDQFLDDDLFGYFIALKGNNFQRNTVLANGTLVSVTPERVTSDFGTMSRGFQVGDDLLIHEHELYSAALAGDVLLDLPRAGTFEISGGVRLPALTPSAVSEALENGAQEVGFRGCGAVRLPLAERRRRVALLLRTLATVRGGAHRALHYGERSPMLFVLAPVKGGNNPFTHVVRNRSGVSTFSSAVFRKELIAWSDEIDGPALLGWAPGFLAEQRDLAGEELADLITSGQVVLDHPRVLLNALADRIEAGEHDSWFEDPER